MKIKDNCFSLLGSILNCLHSLYVQAKIRNCIVNFASFGKGSSLGYPFLITGTNKYTPGVKYIHIGEGVSLGAGTTIFATRAHVYIGDHSFSGPHLTIMTGDHPADIKGKFIADNRKVDLEKQGVDISKYDQDVVIEEDVWLGSNVTILKGVHIGRGAIVAAGSVVTSSLPAYCVGGGVPAKVIKYRWSVDDIVEHEKLLYKDDERLSREFICECLQVVKQSDEKSEI